MDMLDIHGIPAQLKALVNDYPTNLIQVLESDAYRFQNTEVQDFFDIMRNIYRKD